jgi:uncharacterized RDD family membrane protein YckC
MGQWRPAPPPLAPNGQPLATFLDRFLAYLLDSLIIGAIGALLVVPLMLAWFVLLFNQFMNADRTGVEPDVAVILVSYLVFFGIIVLVTMLVSYLYYVEYQVRHNGQTVGKQVMKLWVTPVNPAEQLTRTHLVKRWAVQSLVAQVVPLFGLLDGLWQLWDKPLQQCLHDKAAQTVVVKLG